MKRVLRIGLVALGVVMTILPFVAHLLIDAQSKVSAQQIAVVRRDIEAGQSIELGDVRFEEQVLNPSLARLYVRRDEFEQYSGGFVVDRMRMGEPLLKVKLLGGDHGLALKRYALALDNPDDVIMTLPVGPDLIPGRISAGDAVNIIFASGGALSDRGLQPRPGGVTVLAASAAPAPEGVQATPPEASAVVLPVADVMLENVEIIEVTRAVRTDIEGAVEAEDTGPVSAIVVRVPRAFQTLLAFGSSTSQLRFAIASPRVDPGALSPAPAMSWGKYAELLAWKEAQAFARGETLTSTLLSRHVLPQPGAVVEPTPAVALPTATPRSGR